MTDLEKAIADLRRATPANSPWVAEDFECGFAGPVILALPVVVQAAASGELIPATPEALAASPEVQALVMAERERCARIATRRKGDLMHATVDHPYDRGYLDACDQCAAAIRAAIGCVE